MGCIYSFYVVKSACTTLTRQVFGADGDQYPVAPTPALSNFVAPFKALDYIAEQA